MLPLERGFVRLLLQTLQRVSETAGMRWSELSDDAKIWTVPRERAKNGRGHVVHLPPAPQAELRAIPRVVGCSFVFPGPSGAITTFGNIKRKLSLAVRAEQIQADPDAAEWPNWRFHDARRSGVSALARMGFAPHVCDRLLNHLTGTISGVAAVYQRHEFHKERAVALAAWAAHITACAQQETHAREYRPARPRGLRMERRYHHRILEPGAQPLILSWAGAWWQISRRTVRPETGVIEVEAHEGSWCRLALALPFLPDLRHGMALGLHFIHGVRIGKQPAMACAGEQPDGIRIRRRYAIGGSLA